MNPGGDPAFIDASAVRQGECFSTASMIRGASDAPLLSTQNQRRCHRLVNFDTSGSGTGYYERFLTSAPQHGFHVPDPASGATGSMRFAISKGGNAAGGESGAKRRSPAACGWHQWRGDRRYDDDHTALLDGAWWESGATALVPKDLGRPLRTGLGRSEYRPTILKGMMDNVSIYHKALSEGESGTWPETGSRWAVRTKRKSQGPVPNG